MKRMTEMEATGKSFVQFVNKCPSPFHVVRECKARLAGSGFVQLLESRAWDDQVKAGGKYLLTRNGSSLCAFVVGKQFKPEHGFKIVAAHTDSPCIRVKPRSHRTEEGMCQVSVDTYGGGIWHTWLDRDLAVAGRVIHTGAGDSLQESLVQIDRPLLKIPNICIHLQRDHNEKFSPNPERHLQPIIATALKHQLNCPPDNDVSPDKKPKPRHSPVLMKLLTEELKLTSPDDITEFELCLYDYNKACLTGAYSEFVSSPRIDNLASCFQAVQAMLDSCDDLEEETQMRMIVLYDHEEVGSVSSSGAQSRMTESILRRLAPGAGFEPAVANSLLMSWDVAHVVHPNYPEKHEHNLKPSMHQGPILKYNCNQRYATNARTAAIVRHLAGRVGIPLQEFAVKNDSPCGSTVGPLLSAKLGMGTVDLGIGCLSMHSMRETCGVDDVHHGKRLMRQFFLSQLPTVNCD